MGTDVPHLEDSVQMLPLEEKKETTNSAGLGIGMRGYKALAEILAFRPCGCADAKSSWCVSIPQTASAGGSARHHPGSCKRRKRTPLVRNKFNLLT